MLGSAPDSEGSAQAFYDVSVVDLIENHFLNPGERLSMFYRPRGGGERKQYEATICPNGALEALGKTFSAPSYAALVCIKDAGSDRETVNGWISWKDFAGRTLAELRDLLLHQPKES
ncbi:MAG: hypothetical protein WBY44_05260 [Bryobacteraceae bacterium]